MRRAIIHAQQAAQLDPEQPTAYAIPGTPALYHNRDMKAAGRAMRSAIGRGGTAAFHICHAHDENFGRHC